MSAVNPGGGAKRIAARVPSIQHPVESIAPQWPSLYAAVAEA